MREGREEAMADWMSIARVMINDFRSAKVFYPWDKYIRFLGYTAEARKRATKSKNVDVMADMAEMADRLQVSLGRVFRAQG